jgi:hypothetical protein
MTMVDEPTAAAPWRERPAGAPVSACADRLFWEADDPAETLREMVRSGGRAAGIVLSQPDWTTLSVETADERTTGRLREFLSRAGRSDGAARLPALLRACGLDEVTITPTTLRATVFRLAGDPLGLPDALERAQAAGAVSPVEAAAWLDELEWASRRGRFVGTLAGVIVAGRRSGG